MQYEIGASGGTKPERIVYVVLSDGSPDGVSIQSEDGKDIRFAYVYRDAGRTTTVAFTNKLGQTVWIGRDRKARLVPTPLSAGDIHLLEDHGGNEVSHELSTMGELLAAIAKLKAEPAAAPNGGPTNSLGKRKPTGP